MQIARHNMAETIDELVKSLRNIIPSLSNKAGGIHAYSHMLEQDNVPETAISDRNKISKLSNDITVTIENASKHYISVSFQDGNQAEPTPGYKVEMNNLVKELGIYLTKIAAQIKSMAENLLSTYTLEGNAKKDAEGIIKAADNTLNEVKAAYARLGITASLDEPITYRIVAVDDKQDVRGLIKLLERYPYNHEGRQVTFKVNVLETAEQVLEYLKTNEADLLLTDREMPSTDGWQLLEILGKINRNGLYMPNKEYKLPPARVIMLTGDANEGDIRRIKENGLSYAAKPLEMRELQRKICETIEQTP